MRSTGQRVGVHTLAGTVSGPTPTHGLGNDPEAIGRLRGYLISQAVSNDKRILVTRRHRWIFQHALDKFLARSEAFQTVSNKGVVVQTERCMSNQIRMIAESFISCSTYCCVLLESGCVVAAGCVEVNGTEECCRRFAMMCSRLDSSVVLVVMIFISSRYSCPPQSINRKWII